MNRNAGKFRIRGSTLSTVVVLLATSAVLAVAAHFSVSSYRQYAMRITRLDAQRELQAVAGRLERCLGYGGEVAVDENPLEDCVTFPLTTPEDTYLITGNIEGRVFTLTATPLATQAQDIECGALTLNHLGLQGITGTGARESCWAVAPD